MTREGIGMTQFDDRLERWARQAGAGPVVSPDAHQLFRNGKRWAHRRRVVTAAAFAFVVMVLATSSFLLRPNAATPAPAGPGSAELALPDRVFEVPRRLADLGRGEVAGVLPTVGSSGWFGEENVIVGISARTGEYGRLDTPKLADPHAVVLSPGGKRLAWPTCGMPTGTPNTSSNGECATTGIAIRNLSTGELEPLPLESPHGLDEVEMLWIDDETLVVTAYQMLVGDDGPVERQTTAVAQLGLIWTAGRGATPVHGLDVDGYWSRVVDGQIVHTNRRRVVSQSPRTGKIVRSRDVPYDLRFYIATPPAWQGGMRRVATAGTDSRSPGPLRWADVDADLQVKKWHQFSTPNEAYRVLGWRGDSVLALAGAKSGAALREASVVAVDTESGKVSVLIEYPGMTQSGSDWQWATTLLSEAPTRPGVEPHALRDPRWIVGIGSLLVLTSVAGLLWWRRRPRV